MRWKVLRTDCELECPTIDAELRKRGAELVLLPDDVSDDRLKREVADADLVLMCYRPITRPIIEAGRKLKGIVKYGVGIDAIDIKAAIEQRVPVVNIPAYAEETVAEGAFLLMLALAKKLMPITREMQHAGWLWPTSVWLGSDIAEKTVGLVGLGRIGQSLARMAGAGFRAKVVGYDPHRSTAEMAAIGVEKYDDLTAMLKASDFVSIHAVLNHETRHLIGERELKAMKPSAYLINVSRGEIVDEKALVRALRENRIAGAGLDVYGNEPLAKNGHPMSDLYAMPNVILLPHLTFYTKEAMARLERETLERCTEILEGRPVLIKSRDPRLRAQSHGVVFAD
ncbi:MAG: 2-hydroxyacid dehydrogenase [Geminicoccaceae bacterium]